MRHSFNEDGWLRRGAKLGAAVLTLSAGLLSSYIGAATVADAPHQELVYIGSQGNQISAARFDPGSGRLSMIGPVAEGLRPTWTVAHPHMPVLYAVDDERAKDGSVTAFAVDRASGALTRINQAGTGGKGSTHLWLDAPSNTLLAANFGSGSASSIAIKPDGSLGALVSTITASAPPGPHRRQDGPHAHSVAVDLSGRHALVADLGADRLYVYGFDRGTRKLTADDAARRPFAAAPGSGPRHFALGPEGLFIYLLNELTAEVTTLRWDAQSGRATLAHSVAVSTPDFKEARSGSEIAVSSDGRFVYVGNRAQHQLVVYRADALSGELLEVQRIASGGQTPWAFALHSSGKWMLVANQKSGKVNLFSVDRATGMLADTGQAVEAPTPVSVTLVK